ncbi:MAG: type II toxin-antitoxin system YafQ family toxin [Bacteroidales bacterium]
MRQVKSGSLFRKELKRYRNDRKKMEKLFDIVCVLEQSKAILKEFKPHMLSGNYVGYMECHITIQNIFERNKL